MTCGGPERGFCCAEVSPGGSPADRDYTVYKTKI
jgi:hypothetical protein